MAEEPIEWQAEELAVLLMAWRLLKRAYDALVSVDCSDLKPPDLDRFAVPQLERFLDEAGLSARQRSKVQGSARKTEDYLGTISSMRMRSSEGALVEYTNYIILEGPSIEPGYAAKYLDASTKLQDALRHGRLAGKGLDLGGQEADKASAALQSVAALIAELGGDLQGRIFRAGPPP